MKQIRHWRLFSRTKPAQHHSPDPLAPSPLVWGATPPKWTSQHTNQCGRRHVVYAKRRTGACATLHTSEATGADKTGQTFRTGHVVCNTGDPLFA